MSVPIIDIFAGPGGLGEGFADLRSSGSGNPFEIAMSVEKDPIAHQTLTLRAFFRRLSKGERTAYRAHVVGEKSREQLFNQFPAHAKAAQDECREFELKPENAVTMRDMVTSRLRGASNWVLIGGPPCQAYSLIGRSRNKGNADYRAEDDQRQTLYVEYLQILADHSPSVFVMENVKGLLSATLSSNRLFDRIREDLHNPAAALSRAGRKARGQPRYQIHSITTDALKLFADKPVDFVVRSERYGVPQARHRVILLGVLEGSAAVPQSLQQAKSISVRDALGDLPRLRSGLSRESDSATEWRELMKQMPARSWNRFLSDEVRKAIRRNSRSSTVPDDDRGAEAIAIAGSDQPVLNHSSRGHIRADLERYFFASSFAEVTGQSPRLCDFPRTLLPHHDNVEEALSTGIFNDRFRVQLSSRPASTVTSHIAKDGHYYIHYDATQCRSLTVREAARLQTFPDNYFFCGPRTSQYHQVGNAVPPKLASQIARIVNDLVR